MKRSSPKVWKTNSPQRIRSMIGAFLLVLLLSTGCNLSSNRSAPPASVVDASSSPPVQDVVQESGATPAPEIHEFEPPPPTGLVNQLYAGVESGAWSYEQGLVESLKVFTGEVQVDDFADRDRPASLEGSGLIREAQVYLRSGQDTGMRAEIERLLSVIAPAPERLLEVADPESVSRARGPGYAAQLNITEDCAALYEKGFPPGSGLKCLLYKEGGIGGQLLRVFYPIPSVPLDYADQAYDGMMQAFQTYSTLKPNGAAPQMKGADLLFVLLPEIEDPTTLAMVPTTGSDDRCLIVVYLGAIQENETSKSAPDDYGHFLQTVAHEMFHCFQTWNYPAQADGTWKVQDWWGEGTAEFFSNVVYPKVNSEWSWTGTFSYHSSHRPLTELDYDNFVFFQYLADEQGLNAVLNLIGAMPSTGNEADQASALSKLSGMDALFHNFGQAFLDGQIIDSSGSVVPTLPAYVLPEDVITVKEAQIRLLGGEPFVLKRYSLVFPQGYRYTVAQIDKSKAPAAASSRLDLSNSAWGDLPEQVLTACSPVTYLELVTTTQTGSGKAAVEVSLTPQEELACDNCLIGTWDLDTPSFADYLAAPFKDTPGLFSIDSMGGIWKLHFSPQSIVTGEYDYYVGYELDQTGGGSGFGVLAQVLLDITGDGAAQFIADGVGHVAFNLLKDDLSMEQTILINGQEVPGSGNLLSGMGPSLSNGISGEAQYSCDDDTGTLYLAYDLGGSLAEPIKYNRISKSP